MRMGLAALEAGKACAAGAYVVVPRAVAAVPAAAIKGISHG